MNRYEANIDGKPEEGEVFTDFDEINVFTKILEDLNWDPEIISQGRGGYYLFLINVDSQEIKLHVYLKKITFGGRENRPFEKRAQFSAALDRRGFEASLEETQNELSVILAIYKREKFEDTIICAWDIHEWGYNVGRAFNCFVSVEKIAEALESGWAQHKTSIGQIACCFRPEVFNYYLKNKSVLHKKIVSADEVLERENISPLSEAKDHANDEEETDIPKFDDLFQLVLHILRLFKGMASVQEIELKAAELLELPFEVWHKVHNLNEGYRTVLGYRLAWARFYLKKAGLIENPERSLWRLTELGRKTLTVDKDKIKKIATEREINKEIEEDVLNSIKNEIKTEEDTDVEAESNAGFSEIENPFDPNQVDIKTRTMSLDLILKRLDRDEIDMNTSFQRKASLWDITKQSRLIESILIKFPLPAFYFDGSNDDKWLVVDGLQRLSSLDNFVNKRSLLLKNLEFLSQFNGMSFTQLPGNLQRRIEEFEITAYIISPGTPKALKYNVFRRINTGGLTLTSQEIRNAIFNGKPAEFIKALSELRSFKQATAFAIPEDRMLDREFVLRFLAFFISPLEEYKSDLDSFLNSAMERVYSMTKEELEAIAANFDNAMSTAIEIFGDDAFRKRYMAKDKRKPINKALFEVWSVLLSRLNKKQNEKLIQNANEIKAKLMALLNNDQEFNWAISSSTGDKTRVKKRFAEINKIIQDTLA